MLHIIDVTNESIEKVNSLKQRFTDISYDYILSGNTLTVSISVSYTKEPFNETTDTFQIPINIKTYAGQYIVIWLMRDFIPYLNPNLLDENQNPVYVNVEKFIGSYLTFSYSQLYGAGYLFKDAGSIQFACLYITKDMQDIYIHPYFKYHDNTGTIENAEYITQDVTFHRRNMLTPYCSELNEYLNKWLIKKEVLDPNIDVSKSAAYLETEVDTLYKIVELLIQKTGIDITEYQPIIDAVARHNVLDIKNINKLVSEIDEDKGNIRAKQKDFYKEAYE